MSTKDGPPRRRVDISKIPNAKPRAEAKSAYGNPESYKVMGKRYRVLKTANGYSKRGIASWYGRKFHGRLTSTRERYNMLAMTGASPELPIPCYVRVTNLSNHRSVIVRINDRGPFAPNRILDLSYVAAKKLGYASRGTAYVQVDTVGAKDVHDQPPVFANQRSEPIAITQGRQQIEQYLQVGAFATQARAEQLRQQLRADLQQPVRIATNFRSAAPFRVQVGPVKSLAEANAIRQVLNAHGLSAFSTH